jgi:CO dehydrogenase maturation factor
MTTIALAGKGGVGKTTIAAMVIKYLAQTRKCEILGIDADPSSNLNLALGLPLEWTIGDIRENLLEQVKTSLTAGGAAMGSLPDGMSKREYLDYQIRYSLSEGVSFDMIAMGRSEGQGCYCAVNHNLREVIDSISRNYRYVVIDNEAGLEHLSRRTTRDVQIMLIVSDLSMRGIVAAERVAGFCNELDINIEKSYLILNNAHGNSIPAVLQEHIDSMGVPLLGVIPHDEQITEFDASAKPLIQLGEGSTVYRSVAAMLEKVVADFE